jgi:hypothetical protein
MSLEDAAAGYANFAFNQNDWTKVVLKPGWEKGREQAGPARAIIAQRGEVGATGRQGALERA